MYSGNRQKLAPSHLFPTCPLLRARSLRPSDESTHQDLALPRRIRPSTIARTTSQSVSLAFPAHPELECAPDVFLETLHKMSSVPLPTSLFQVPLHSERQERRAIIAPRESQARLSSSPRSQCFYQPSAISEVSRSQAKDRICYNERSM